MSPEQPPGPSIRQWADAKLHVTVVGQGEDNIIELRKEMIVNGVRCVQSVWLNRAQLRSVGIDHGL